MPDVMPIALAFPWEHFARLDWRAALDIVLIAAVIYFVLNLLRGTRAAQMMVAVVLLVAAFYGARAMRLEMVEWLLATVLPYFAIALIVLFQPEIRRALARAGHAPFWRRFTATDPTEAHDDVLLAVRHFSQNKIGAIIVLEREVGLRTYIESGVALDAQLTYDLLLSIFHPASPLHDGAVIVQGNRIAAATCFLPLSLNPAISNQLGTRHRSALGVTEESDAVAIVVSEETGAMCLAAGGALELNLSEDALAQRLAALFAEYRPPVALPAPPGGSRAAAARARE